MQHGPKASQGYTGEAKGFQKKEMARPQIESESTEIINFQYFSVQLLLSTYIK